MSKKTKRIQPGETVMVGVRCAGMHIWTIRGTMEEGGRISCGKVSAPGAADDPTVCPQCGKPFTVTYGMMRAERTTVIEAVPVRPRTLWDGVTR